jgi:hypothetical protein
MFKQRVNKSDTIHQIYSNHKIKQQLIDYIYSMIDISKYKYKLMVVSDDLQLLTTTKYHISGNYTGPNCLMVFTRNKDRFYSFIVDRKTLSYKQSQVNIDNVVMNPIELGLDETIYDGTIIDGILSQTEDSKVFIITDLYIFRGEDLTREKIKYKLINIKKYLDTYINQDQNINSITVTVNNLYDVGDIKNLVYKVIPQTKQLPVRGVTFYPDLSGTKLIYLFNKVQQHPNCPETIEGGTGHARTNAIRSSPESERIQYGTYKQFDNPNCGYNNHRFSSYVKPNTSSEPPSGHVQYNQHDNKFSSGKQVQDTMHRRACSPDEIQLTTNAKYRYVCKTDDPIILTFEMRKTEKGDVYKLFLVSKCDDGGKTVLKTKRFGIAYIPSIKCSKMCKDLTMLTGKALVKCKYDNNREKWIPIEQDNTKKCPDLVSTLEGKMDIIVNE